MTERELRLVFLGDCKVGKSSIIKRFLTQQFEEEYQPTPSIGELTSSIKVNQNIVRMVIWDISGKGINMTPDFAAKIFPDFDVFYIVFSCNDKASYENARNGWYNLIEPYMKEDSLVIYVASKADLWDEDEVSQVVTSDEMEDIEALECSSLENEGVRAVFHTALRWALQMWENPSDASSDLLKVLNQPDGLSVILNDQSLLSQFKNLLRQKGDGEGVKYIEKNILDIANVIVSDEFTIHECNTVCDFFTNNTKLLGMLCVDDVLKLILESLVVEHVERRRGTIILRLLNFIFVSHRDKLLEYIQNNKLFSYFIENLNENVIDFIQSIMEILKAQKKGDPGLDCDIFDRSEVIPILNSILKGEKIALVATLVSALLNNGESNNFLKDVITYNDMSFLILCFELLADKESEYLRDTVSLFMDFIFPLIKENVNDEDFLNSVGHIIENNVDLISELIDSESILTVFYGIQLCNGLATSYSQFLPMKLFTKMSNTMYRFTHSSTLHTMIADSIISVIDSQRDDEFFINLFEDKSIFIDNILEKLEDEEQYEYLPHLKNIVTALENCELSKNILIEYSRWKDFIDAHWEEMQTVPGNDDIYTPSNKLLKDKERQIQGPRGNRNFLG